jgi:hypothetical protein
VQEAIHRRNKRAETCGSLENFKKLPLKEGAQRQEVVKRIKLGGGENHILEEIVM